MMFELSKSALQGAGNVFGLEVAWHVSPYKNKQHLQSENCCWHSYNPD